jgi:drug/metabolite transporter (DMT)-like permease
VTRRGWLLFLAMCLLWGIPYLLIKVVVEELSPPFAVFARAGVAAIVLLPIAAARGQLRQLRGHWRWVIVFALLEITIPWLFLNDAERHLTSSLTGLLVAAVPLVAGFASRLVGAEDRLDRNRLIGLLVGICGVAALLGLDLAGEWWAAVEIGIVVIGYGTAPLIASRQLAAVPPLAVIAASLGLTGLVYAPVAAFNWPDRVPPAKVVGSLAVLVVFCTIAAFLVFFALIAEAGPNRALVITFVNPAVAVLLGTAILSEPVTAGMLVGFPLILLGCFLATRQTRVAAVTAVAEP